MAFPKKKRKFLFQFFLFFLFQDIKIDQIIYHFILWFEQKKKKRHDLISTDLSNILIHLPTNISIIYYEYTTYSCVTLDD